MFGYIYETTNLVNGKTYIGKKQGEFDKTYYGSGMILKQALEKYGRENFEVVVLSTYDTEEDLNNAEVMFIETRDPTYNIAKGGTGGDTLARADEEYKQEVIAKRKQGMSNAWSNASEEQRKQWGENISKAKKGKATRPADYTHSEEVKQRIRESNLKATKPDDWYDNHSKAMAARKGVPNAKCFKPVEVNGVVYTSVTEACEKVGISKPTLYKWMKKEKQTMSTKVGFTASTFDLLHAGHVQMLREAKEQCDYLICGLQVDPSVDRAEKNAPIQTVVERYTQLKAVSYVDEIVPYSSEKDLEDILTMYHIDVRILGEEYRDKEFTGKDICRKRDIDLYFNKRDHRFSSSDLRKRVAEGKTMTEGPFKSAFDADTVGVVRREIVTYRIKNGAMVKETAVRDYYKDGDYHDSQNAMPLVER